MADRKTAEFDLKAGASGGGRRPRSGARALRRDGDADDHRARAGLTRGDQVPALLVAIDDYEGRWGVPAVAVRSAGWEGIGLGALQDLVHDAFGDVQLDRSAVQLAPVEPLDDDCLACDRETFAFPSGLEEAQEHLRASHVAASEQVRLSRLLRARASNPAGWRAIDKAAARINGEPEPIFTPLPKRTVQSISRNDPCPCGSGLNHKRCHGA